MLLEAGASPYAEAYGDGGTPLAVALFWGHRALAERLAEPLVAPLNLRVAAGLGRLDLMRNFFDGGRLGPKPAGIANSTGRTAAFRRGGRATMRAKSSPRR